MLFLGLLIIAMPLTAANIRHYGVGIGIASATADTPYVLIDLDDTTNFRHGNTAAIIIRDIYINSYSSAAAAIWQIYIGVVVENDSTDGTAEWLLGPLDGILTSGPNTWTRHITFTHTDAGRSEGLNLTVDTTNNTLKWFLTNSKQADSANWQNDTNRTSPAGATTKPGVGDLVMLLDEVSGSATFAGSILVIYDTE